MPTEQIPSTTTPIDGPPQRRSVRLLIACAVALFGLFISLWYFSNRSATIPPAKGSTMPARSGLRNPLSKDQRGFLGVLMARRSINIAAVYGGRVKEVLVKLGQRVAKDDKVAILDNAPVRHALAAAKANLLAARASTAEAAVALRAARARYKRRVVAAGTLSKEALETAKSNRQLAAAQSRAAGAGVAAQAAQIASLEEKLASATIRAPFAGKVAAVFNQAGSLLQPGQAIIRLIDPDEVWVRFAVPAENMNAAKLGGKVAVRGGDLSNELVGQIRNVAPELEPSSGTLFVEAKVNVARLQTKLPLGAAVRVFIVAGAAPASPTTMPAKPAPAKPATEN